MTATGIVVWFIVWGLKYVGVEGVEEGAVTEFVANIVQAGAFLLMIWGQARRGDIKGFFFKK